MIRRFCFTPRLRISSAPSRHMSLSSTDRHIPNLLVPTKENLEILNGLEFSSFDDSQSLITEPVSLHHAPADSALKVLLLDSIHDEDDPFDPNDLVGILANPSSIESSTQQLEFHSAAGELGSSQNPIDVASSPECSPANESLASEALPRAAALINNDLSHIKLEHQSSGLNESLLRTSPQKRVLSPSNMSPAKKPTLASSSPVKIRSYFSQEQMRQLHTKNSHLSAGVAGSTAAFAHPTIQLATQRPTLDGLPILERFEKIKVFRELEQLEERKVKPIILSREQEYVLQLAKEGKSIFFTGSAGTGKSVLLKSIIKTLKDRRGSDKVAVTASTGMAACNIGGMTVHSFAGIGLGKGKEEELIKMVRRNKKVVARWRSVQVLVIDEISMIDGNLFDKIDSIARIIRKKKDKPFGGLQVIVCGDFYQLPPVSKSVIQPDGSEVKEIATFAFESHAWHNVLHSRIILKEIFRQKGDQTFIDMLNNMRHGIVTPQAEDEFLRLSRPLNCPDGIVPTELFATRNEVEQSNNSKLARLDGSSRIYESRDGGSLPPTIRNMWLSNFLAPQRLFLKEKAQVMCIKNYDETLVNGTLGQVVGFYDRETYMCGKLIEEKPGLLFEDLKGELARRKIAHLLSQELKQEVKAEDITEEKYGHLIAKIEHQFDSVFDFMLEEKPSATPQDSESETERDKKDLAAINRERKLTLLCNLEKSSKGEKLPLVRFYNPDGVTTRDVLVEPELWLIEDETSKEILVSRIQVPLMLAWALSIHKSQGQTLLKVKVDLSRVFENGQAYVALSRATSREGLQVLNFRKERVRTHPIVENFYESLSTTEDLRQEE